MLECERKGQKNTMAYPTRIIIRRIRSVAFERTSIKAIKVSENMCRVQKGSTTTVYKQMFHINRLLWWNKRMAHIMVQIPSNAKLTSTMQVVLYQMRDIFPSDIIPVPIKKPIRLMSYYNDTVIFLNLRSYPIIFKFDIMKYFIEPFCKPIDATKPEKKGVTTFLINLTK